MTNASLPMLTLVLKSEYFEAIKAGQKLEEYRLIKDYWAKRLEGRNYAGIVLTKGYPPASDLDSRLVRLWRGYTIKTITHEHFGPDPVRVYAIDVAHAAPALKDQK